MTDDLLELARRYLQAIEAARPEHEMQQFFTADVIQEEFPNRFVPNGARRDLAALLEAGRRGRAVVENQRYEILNAVVAAPWVALEVAWSATLKVAVGSMAAGDVMRARFGVFIEFRDGRIRAQRNYDCFEPF
jgi:ketosteroid isomerase-like protein